MAFFTNLFFLPREKFIGPLHPLASYFILLPIPKSSIMSGSFERLNLVSFFLKILFLALGRYDKASMLPQLTLLSAPQSCVYTLNSM